MSLPILEHLKNLQKRALAENKTEHEEMKEYDLYYRGRNKDNKRKYFNIIKGIVDTKTSFVLDNEIVSTVVPQSKSFSDLSQLNLYGDIADILKDCNKHVLAKNNIEEIKRKVVKNANIFGRGYCETVWSQDNEEELGDVKIVPLSPLNCFRDTSAEKIKDSNYFLIKETYSTMSLKKKYPQFADKIDKAATVSKDKSDKDKNTATGVVTVTNPFNTSQMFTDGKAVDESISQAKNVVVWKAYIKDDATFLDETDPEKKNLSFRYPNGRLFMWVEGASDYVLEDRQIDYPFGFPIDELTVDSAVEPIMKIQDRIDKAFEKIRYLIGAFVSFIAHTPMSGLASQEIINDLLIMVDKLGEMEVITNNTLSELEMLLRYIQVLKEQAYELARVNPAMISGKKESGVNSGLMVEALNESPMTTVREMQRIFKDFIISQGGKNIILIQLYYSVPRIVRLSGEQLALISPKINEGDEAVIEIYEQNEDKEYQAIKTIKGDLSIGFYDVEVIAGTEMPRSRAQKAQVMLQLKEMGLIPPTRGGTDALLTALDVPDKTAILESLDQAEIERQKSQPKINIPIELAGKIFKDMNPIQQNEYLEQFGFTASVLTGGDGDSERIDPSAKASG